MLGRSARWLVRPSGGAAGIDRQHRAGDIAGFLAEQEFDRMGYVGNLRHPAQRAAPRDGAALVVLQRRRHVGLDKARRHGIDVDAELADFTRQRPGETDHRGFGRAVDGEPAEAGEGDDRSHVDDAAAAPGHHGANQMLGQHDRGHGVEPHQFLDLRCRHGGEDAAGSVGGIVDQPVDAAERLAQALGEIRDPVDVAEVERHEMQHWRARIDRVGEFGEFLARAPRDGDHFITGAGQLPGDAEAQPAAAAGDHDFWLRGHCERCSFPVAAISSLGTNRMRVGTLCGRSAARHPCRMSSASRVRSPSTRASDADGLITTSATTNAPVIGLRRARTSDT